MALQAVAVTTEVAPSRGAFGAPSAPADAVRPATGARRLAAVRHARATWLVAGALLVAVPFASCLVVLEVVR